MRIILTVDVELWSWRRNFELDIEKSLKVLEKFSIEEKIPLTLFISLSDKGYDCKRNHQIIEKEHHCQSFIILKKNRKGKRFKKKMKSELYQTIIKQRYKIERRFADAKNNHGLAKCRWLGRFKTEIQAYLTSICLNCKRIVFLTYQNPQYCLQKA